MKTKFEECSLYFYNITFIGNNKYKIFYCKRIIQ